MREAFSEAKGLGFRAYLNEVTADDIDIPRLEEAIAALSGQIKEILDDHVLAQESRTHEEKLWEQITKSYN